MQLPSQVASVAVHPGAHPIVRVLRLAVVVAYLASIGMVASAPPSSASPASDAAEVDLYNRTNQARAAAGLSALANDRDAAAVARDWSQQMAREARLYHNPNLAAQVGSRVTPEWTRIGENVGYGGSIVAIPDAYMQSTGHRGNILGDFNRVGVGVAIDSSGRLWTAVVFVKGPPLPVYDPLGSFEVAVQVMGGIRVAGWAIDPETSSPIEVHVYVDNGGNNLGLAAIARPDVGAAYAGYGTDHGFDANVGAAPGWHQVCAYAQNVGQGWNRLLGCRAVNVG